LIVVNLLILLRNWEAFQELLGVEEKREGVQKIFRLVND
jgi:hypothetical protein